MAHKENWDALPLGNMQQSCGALSDLQAKRLSQSCLDTLDKLLHHAEHESPPGQDIIDTHLPAGQLTLSSDQLQCELEV